MFTAVEKIIQFRDYGLCLGLDDKSVQILKDINLDIQKGKILGLIGASGSGKSMLLKSILQLFEGIRSYRTVGQILVSSNLDKPVDITELKTNLLLELRQKHFGYVFQLTTEILNPAQHIKHQLAEKLKLINYKNEEIEKRCREVLVEVGISDPELTMGKYPHQLSGGQLQRILIAIGIITKPRILLIDEPTSALDQSLKVEILELITHLRESLDMTIVLVSHNMKLISKYCDDLAVISEGMIVESGRCSDVIGHPKSIITKELLDEKTIEKFNEDFKSSHDLLITLINIQHAFDSSNSWFSKYKQNVIDNFNFEIRKGEIVGLVGNSGSGKSTLGKIISGLMIPNEGDVLYKNKPYHLLSKTEYNAFRYNVQIIFQDTLGSLSPHRNGKQVLKEAMDILGLTFNSEFVNKKLSEVSLDSSILQKTPKQMSGGQRQRLLIARALLAHPELLICDEILSSLDTIVKKQILICLKQVSEIYNMAILFISHDLEVVEGVSDRVIAMPNLV